MKFQKKVLSNGLNVLHEKRDVPVTTVMLSVKYGSMHELESEKGIAHFIEHMLFKGTEKRDARQVAFEVERLGGVINAFTAEEETAFYVKIPSEHLGIAMDVIFDIFFNASFPEQEVKKEGNVICEEIKMYKDDPTRYVLEKIKSGLYKSPFGMMATGTEEIVRGLSREKLFSKHREIYSPENAILSVVGNNNFEDVVRFAEKLSPKRELNKAKLPGFILQNAKTREQRKDIQQANLTIGFHIPFDEKGKYSAQVFQAILGGGMSGKLFTEVREKRGLAYAVKVYAEATKEYGYLVIYVGTDKEKVDEVIKICIKEFRKMKDISEEELEDGKKQAIGNFEIESEDSSHASIGLISEEFYGNAENYYKYAENIKKVTLKDIASLAQIKDYSYFILSP